MAEMTPTSSSTWSTPADALAAVSDREKAAAQLQRANTLTAISTGAKSLAALGKGVSSYRTALARQAVYSMNAASILATIPQVEAQAEQKVDIIQQETAQFIGAQRAALAANGVIVDQDTGLEAMVQAAGVGARDVVDSLNAARREVASLRTRAAVAQADAKESKRAGQGALLESLASAGTTILGGADTISKSNQRYRASTGG